MRTALCGKLDCETWKEGHGPRVSGVLAEPYYHLYMTSTLENVVSSQPSCVNTRMRRTKEKLKGYGRMTADDANCECAERQTSNHLLECIPSRCEINDRIELTETTGIKR